MSTTTTRSIPDQLPAALNLAAAGVRIFPCNNAPGTDRDKAPAGWLVPNGYKEATTDERRIRTWFDGTDYLIGVPTGEVNGFDCPDIDPRNGGDEWLRQNGGDLPRTRVHETGSGGLHLLFDAEPGLRSGTEKIAPGVDVKANGGYIIWWPAAGCQIARELPRAAWPAPLLQAIKEKQPAAVAQGGSVALERRAPPSADAVVTLLDRMPNPDSAGRDVYEKVMLAAVGCIRALDEKGELGPDDEQRIVEAAIGWAERWPGCRTDEWQKWLDDWSRREGKLAGYQTLQRVACELIPGYAEELEQERGEQAKAEFAAALLEAPASAPTHDGRGGAGAQEPKRQRLLSIDAIEALPDPCWLVEGLLPDQGLAIAFGAPKHGKTFVALSMALHVAAGIKWFGRAVEQGAVVYIAGEGAGGLKLRVRAARSRYGISADIPFWALPRAVNLSDGAAVRDLATLIRETVGHVPVRLIVVDTLACATPGVDENSAGDMGRVIAHCDWLKEEFACTILPIHHQGKDATKGMRGSSALDGAVDTLLHVSRQKTGTDDVVTVSTTYQKDADEGQPITFDLVKVEATAARTSLALALREGGAPKAEKRTGQQQAALDVLAGLVVAQGGGEIDEAVYRGVCVDGRRVSGSESPKTRREAFNTAFTALVRRGDVCAEADKVWLPEYGRQRQPTGGDLASLIT